MIPEDSSLMDVPCRRWFLPVFSHLTMVCGRNPIFRRVRKVRCVLQVDARFSISALHGDPN